MSVNEEPGAIEKETDVSTPCSIFKFGKAKGYVKHYRVEVVQQKTDLKLPVQQVRTNEVVFDNLVADQRYSYRIQAFNHKNNPGAVQSGHFTTSAGEICTSRTCNISFFISTMSVYFQPKMKTF